MGASTVAHLALIAIRTAVVAVYLIAGLRTLGKRHIAQFNLYDLVLIMAAANAVQNAMTRGEGSIWIGLVSAGTLILLGRAATGLFVRLPKLEERIAGSPTLIVNDGRLVKGHMRRESVTEEEVMAALRAHGLGDPGDAQLVVLEVDGSMSVIPKRRGGPGGDAAKRPHG